MSALAIVLVGLLTVAYFRAVLVVLAVAALVLMLFGCAYVAEVMHGAAA